MKRITNWFPLSLNNVMGNKKLCNSYTNDKTNIVVRQLVKNQSHDILMTHLALSLEIQSIVTLMTENYEMSLHFQTFNRVAILK